MQWFKNLTESKNIYLNKSMQWKILNDPVSHGHIFILNEIKIRKPDSRTMQMREIYVDKRKQIHFDWILDIVAKTWENSFK